MAAHTHHWLFPWIDNSRKPGEIMDVYQSGDVAPEGRFMYQFYCQVNVDLCGNPENRK